MLDEENIHDGCLWSLAHGKEGMARRTSPSPTLSVACERTVLNHPVVVVSWPMAVIVASSWLRLCGYHIQRLELLLAGH